MKTKTNNRFVHQVLRPIWDAWMRFGTHRLAIPTTEVESTDPAEDGELIDDDSTVVHHYTSINEYTISALAA